MKKLTINRLALGNLKHRRKQYSIMLIGILLAMIFSSATLFFIFSLISTNNEMLYQRYGKEHVMLIDIDQKILDELNKADAFTEFGGSHFLGYAYTDDERLGSTVAWADDGFRNVSYQSLLDGRYPENEGEIAAEKTALLQLGFEPEIGQTIKINFKIQNGEDYLEKGTEKEYTVVGILSDKKFNLTHGYSDDVLYWKVPAIFVKNNTPVDAGGKERTLCYACFENRNDIYDRENTFQRVFLENGVDSINLWGRSILPIDKSWDYQIDGYLLNNVELTVALSIVLFIASGMVIINSFNNNLKERKKQIGMLRAVGATKRQIRRIFSREALIITLVCLPLSLLISVFGVLGVSKLIFDESVTLIPEWRILRVSAVVSIIMVMISAMFPLFSASRITPMQAIRDISVARKFKNKKIKTQKQFTTENLLAKRYKKLHKGSTVAVIFVLALTVFISCFGVSLVKDEYDNTYEPGYDYRFYDIGGHSFIELYNYSQNGLNENEFQEIGDFPYIGETSGIKLGVVNLVLDEYDDYFTAFSRGKGSSVLTYNTDYGMVSDENNPGETVLITKDNWERAKNEKVYQNGYLKLKEAFNIKGDYYPTAMLASNSKNISELESAVVDGKIDIEKINSGKEIILIAPQKIGMAVKEYKQFRGAEVMLYMDSQISLSNQYVVEATLPYKAGDTVTLDTICTDRSLGDSESEGPGIDLSAVDYSTREVTIGAVVSLDKLNQKGHYLVHAANDLNIVTSVQGMEYFIKGAKYNQVYINSSVELDEEKDKAITEFLTTYITTHAGEIYSVYADNAWTKAEMKTLLLSLTAVIILFVAIAASIVNNSIAARIRENKREIGTLRAVGADAKVLASSYIKQLFSIFGWGIGLGIISIAAVYIGCIVHGRIVGIMEDFNMRIVVLPTVIVCIVLFLICSVNLWLKVKKEMKNSIVENIREL